MLLKNRTRTQYGDGSKAATAKAPKVNARLSGNRGRQSRSAPTAPVLPELVPEAPPENKGDGKGGKK